MAAARTTRRFRSAGLVTALLLLTACAADAGAIPTREYTARLHMLDNADEYEFVADDPLDLRVGDRVTFAVENRGVLPHDLLITKPDGSRLAYAEPVAGGASLTLTTLFDEPGFYRLTCLVGDHLTKHNMLALVEVKPAAG
jgi:plastocyanin